MKENSTGYYVVPVAAVYNTPGVPDMVEEFAIVHSTLSVPVGHAMWIKKFQAVVWIDNLDEERTFLNAAENVYGKVLATTFQTGDLKIFYVSKLDIIHALIRVSDNLIRRTKGHEYSPTSSELQKEIGVLLNKTRDGFALEALVETEECGVDCYAEHCTTYMVSCDEDNGGVCKRLKPVLSNGSNQVRLKGIRLAT